MKWNEITWYSRWANIIICLIIIAIISFYIRAQHQATQDSMPGWVTYKSDMYNYEIQYPSAYKLSKSSDDSASAIETADAEDATNYYSVHVFARSQDFIVQDCLPDLNGNIATTKQINGIPFSIYTEKTLALDAKGNEIPGNIESEYHTMHNNKCYIVQYSISPKKVGDLNEDDIEQLNLNFNVLDQIFSTFKFTA